MCDRQSDSAPECRASPSPLSVTSVVTLQATVAGGGFAPVSKVLNVGYTGRGTVLFCGYLRVYIDRSQCVSAFAALPCCSGCDPGRRPPRRPSRASARPRADLQNILEGNWQSCQETATGATPSASTTTWSTASGSSRCTRDRGREFAISTGCRTSTATTHSPDNLLKPYRVVLAGHAREAALGDSVAEPRVHGHARRRLPHRLRELVHPPRAARENIVSPNRSPCLTSRLALP